MVLSKLGNNLLNCTGELTVTSPHIIREPFAFANIICSTSATGPLMKIHTAPLPKRAPLELLHVSCSIVMLCPCRSHAEHDAAPPPNPLAAASRRMYFKQSWLGRRSFSSIRHTDVPSTCARPPASHSNGSVADPLRRSHLPPSLSLAASRCI